MNELADALVARPRNASPVSLGADAAGQLGDGQPPVVEADDFP